MHMLRTSYERALMKERVMAASYGSEAQSDKLYSTYVALRIKMSQAQDPHIQRDGKNWVKTY